MTHDQIIIRQQNFFNANGKYEKFMFNADTDVHEYVSPEGAGFLVIETRSSNGIIERKVTDYGPSGRSTDWVKLES